MPEAPNDAPEAESQNSSSTSQTNVHPDDPIRATMQLMSEFLGGTASAVSDGFLAFADELNPAIVGRRRLLNGMVEGVIAAQTSFLRGLAETGNRAADILRDIQDQEREPMSEPIDYEHLAKAVAIAIRQERTKTPRHTQG